MLGRWVQIHKRRIITYHIESSGEHDEIELTLLTSSDDALLGELLDWCASLLVDADDLNAVLVENFVVL